MIRFWAALIVALACCGAAQAQDTGRRYRFVHGTALVCRSLVVLDALDQPGAREQFGHVNYMMLLSRGDCAELDNHRPIIVATRGHYNGRLYALAAQDFGAGNAAMPWYVRDSDLAPW